MSSGTRIGKVALSISGHSVSSGGSPRASSIEAYIVSRSSSHLVFISVKNSFSPIASSSRSEILRASSERFLTCR